MLGEGLLFRVMVPCVYLSAPSSPLAFCKKTFFFDFDLQYTLSACSAHCSSAHLPGRCPQLSLQRRLQQSLQQCHQRGDIVHAHSPSPRCPPRLLLSSLPLQATCHTDTKVSYMYDWLIIQGCHNFLIINPKKYTPNPEIIMENTVPYGSI